MADPTLQRPGVYVITHMASGLYYVGAALNVARRWSVHRYGFRKGKHHSVRMQAIWNLEGANALIFRMVEHVPDPLTLLTREQHWLDRLDASNPVKGFNTLPWAHSTTGRILSDATRKKLSECARRQKLSPEHIAALVAANTGRKPTEKMLALMRARKGWRMTPEQRAKVSASHFGRTVTDETRKKISLAFKGRKLSEKHKAALSRQGKPHSAATRLKISLAKRGVRQSPETIAKCAASRRGLKRSAETRAKMSAAKMGKVASAAARANMSAAQKRRFITRPVGM